jgi:hypothetical protein
LNFLKIRNFKTKLIFRKILPVTKKDEIIIEKSTEYLDVPDVPKRVYEFNPKMKLILIVINPVKRAISYFTHRLYRPTGSDISGYDPDKYDSASQRFEQILFDKNGTFSTSRSYFIRGMYVVHYKKWLKYFPKDQILILNGENFVKNPYEEIKKVEVFLNLKQFFLKENFIFNKSKGFYCLKNNLNESKVECLQKDKGRTHIFVRNEVKAKLNTFFKPYDNELFELIQQKPFW